MSFSGRWQGALIAGKGSLNSAVYRSAVVIVFERHKPCNQQRHHGCHKHEYEKVFVAAEILKHKSAEHTGKHHSEIHDSGGKGIVCHLVLAGSHLLHHEESETYKSEAIAEIFDTDT